MIRGRCPGWRGLVLLAVVSLALAGCGDGGSESANDDTSTSDAGVATTSGPDETTAPDDTEPEVLTTVLVGVVVGGNSGGEGRGKTDLLSDTVRTSDTECEGWTGQDTSLEPWTSDLRRGATVRVFDDGGELLGTGTLGPGRPKDLQPNDNSNVGWQCEFEFTLDEVVSASAYFVEVAGLEPLEAESNPLEPDTVVVPVNTPLDADLIEACTDELPDEEVDEWEAVGSYWSVGVEQICFSSLRIRNIRRQCRPAALSALQIISVVGTDGQVLENRIGDGPRVDVATLAPGTLVDVNVTSAVPCG
jgi:hypothetical protein